MLARAFRNVGATITTSGNRIARWLPMPGDRHARTRIPENLTEKQLHSSLHDLSRSAWLGNGVEALEYILRNQTMKESFMQFLQREYAEENLLFWTDVESMKALSGEALVEHAGNIIKRFVAYNAETPLNISSDLRTNLSSMELRPQDVDAIRSEFIVAQKWVLHVMAMDCLPRYLDSEFFLSVIDEMEGEDTTIQFLQSLSVPKSARKHALWLQRFIALCDVMPFCLVISEVEPNTVTGDPYAILHVNPEFTRTTGYTLADTQNRNCRFLQGPETEKDALLAIKKGLALRQPVFISIVNYRKNGEKFTNLLSMRPVFESKAGVCRYYIGMQFDVTHYSDARMSALAPILRFLPEEIWL